MCDALFFFLMIRRPPRSTLFPTRRSSDLTVTGVLVRDRGAVGEGRAGDGDRRDRKSTRLNSSHLVISYAVFCLKKKADVGTEVAETIQDRCRDQPLSRTSAWLCARNLTAR